MTSIIVTGIDPSLTNTGLALAAIDIDSDTLEIDVLDHLIIRFQ